LKGGTEPHAAASLNAAASSSTITISTSWAQTETDESYFWSFCQQASKQKSANNPEYVSY
jgi:hypothetical protein